MISLDDGDALKLLIGLQRVRAEIDELLGIVSQAIHSTPKAAEPAAGGEAVPVKFGQLIKRSDLANPNQVREITADEPIEKKNIVSKYAVPGTAAGGEPDRHRGPLPPQEPPCDPPQDDIPF